MAPAGRVRVSGRRVAVRSEGQLVDVGAGGLRVRWSAELPEPGSRVELEILLDDPDRPHGPPRLVLDGVGRIVWVHAVGDEDDEGNASERLEVGVRFDAPCDVRQSFPDVSVY